MPPTMPSAAAYRNSSGIIRVSAASRGSTRYSNGATPIMRRASISSLASIVARCAAKVAPTRPAMMKAVMIAAISRATAMPTRSARYNPAPKALSCTAPTKPSTAPMSRLTTVTTGSDAAPVSRTSATKSGQRAWARPSASRGVAAAALPTSRATSSTASNCPRPSAPNRVIQRGPRRADAASGAGRASVIREWMLSGNCRVRLSTSRRASRCWSACTTAATRGWALVSSPPSMTTRAAPSRVSAAASASDVGNRSARPQSPDRRSTDVSVSRSIR